MRRFLTVSANPWLTKFWISVQIGVLLFATGAACDADNPDVPRRKSTDLNRSYEAVVGPPAAGKRVAVIAPEYVGTHVHHMLHLPSDWNSETFNVPVIVEYTGNEYAKSGSTGRVEDARLGAGIGGGKYIWLTLPFVSEDGQHNATTWWGNESATLEYAKRNVPRVCAMYGGDPERVFLCGFSRGAIAVNYIGLHDDEVARLWCGFITHDHFDGEREWRGTDWGTPLKTYRESATRRLQRVGDRPYLVCQAGGTDSIQAFLRPLISLKTFTFVDVRPEQILGPFPNQYAPHPHTDRWMQMDSPARRQVRQWLADQIRRSEDHSPGSDGREMIRTNQ